MNPDPPYADGVIREIDGKQYMWVNGNLLAINDIRDAMRITQRAKPEFSDFIHIKLQKGPINEVGVNGCGVEDVIEWCIDTLRTWNDGPMRCRENSLAITSLEEAGNWLTRRHINRMRQGVEGYMVPHSE